MLSSQVKLFNEEASKLLGQNYQDRMYAIQGDISDPDKTPELSHLEWFGFDCVIISFALHHVDDPIDFLKLLVSRVKPGSPVVVVDWLKETVDEPDIPAKSISVVAGEPKYNPENMRPVPMGKIWPGFSKEDIYEDYNAASCTNVDFRMWPEEIDLPKQATFGGRSIMYVSKATAPSK
jgi:SAM-dependent methyltransferase